MSHRVYLGLTRYSRIPARRAAGFRIGADRTQRRIVADHHHLDLPGRRHSQSAPERSVDGHDGGAGRRTRTLKFSGKTRSM